MRTASAQVSVQRRTNLGFAWTRIKREQRVGCHDNAARTITALRRLLGDECALQGVHLCDAADTFNRGHLPARSSAERNVARLHRVTVDHDSTCAAGSDTAAEACALEFEIVAQDVQQRGRIVCIDDVHLSVYIDRCCH